MNRARLALVTAFIVQYALTGASAHAAEAIQTILHRFNTVSNATDGYYPVSLIQSRDGVLYGRTSKGGGSLGNDGSLFKITTDRLFTKLADISAGNAGTNNLTLGWDGNIYGLRVLGEFSGSFFRVTPAGTLTTLHEFFEDEGRPTSSLIVGADGALYGVAENHRAGGLLGGTIYRLTQQGNYSLIYPTPAVIGPIADLHPELQIGAASTLVQGPDGTFYAGTFAVPSTGPPKDLVNSPFNTISAINSIMMASDGNLYLTGSNDRTQNIPVVYRLTTSGPLTILHAFSSAQERAVSAAPLTEAKDGSFYGSTIEGGGKAGYVYRLTKSGDLTILYTFKNDDGYHIIPPLLEGADGNVYGASEFGGGTQQLCLFGCGTVFRLDLGAPPASACPAKGKLLGNPCDRPGGCSAGSAIDVASGNKFEQADDFATAGPNRLGFTRYYNSMGSADPALFTALGGNWRGTFDRTIRIGSPTSVGIERADGRCVDFKFDGSAWATDTDVDLRLRQIGSSWSLIDGDDNVESYAGVDPTKAVLQSVQARNGYTQTLHYDASNLLTDVTDSFGRQLGFTYSGNRLQTVTTPDNLLTYSYTASGAAPVGPDRLASVSYSTTPASTQTYVYENATLPFALTGLIDENNKRYATWKYDAAGRAVSSERAGGADLMTVAYSGAGISTVTYALGQQEVHHFTALQGVLKPVQIERLASAATAAAARNLTYDARGYLASETDWNGNRTTYDNDPRGLPTRMVEAVGTPQERAIDISYDANFHLPKKIIAAGLTTDFNYDSTGNLLTRTLTDTTATTAPYSTPGTTRTWKYTWSSGLLASIQGPRTDLAALTKFTYDETGALASVMNALGQVTQITAHTDGGLPLTIADPNGVTSQAVYDERQRPTAGTINTAAGAITSNNNYDPAGNLLTTKLPDGAALTHSYDDAHRRTGVADLLSQNIAYTLDALGGPTAMKVTSGNSTVKRAGAAAFDALGRITLQTGGAGQTTAYNYDGNGNVLTIKDALGRTTQRFFDPLNRVTKTTDPAGGITAIDYDAWDRPVRVTAPNGAVTSYVHSGFGDLIQQTSPDSGTTVYRYDADGNLVQKTDAGGAVADYSYDALGRILDMTHTAASVAVAAASRPVGSAKGNAAAAAGSTVHYRYDEAGHGFGVGRLTSVSDDAGTLDRSYDERGNLLSETRVNGTVTLRTAYGYDLAGRLVSVTHPSGTAIIYSRDAMGRVSAISLRPPGPAVERTVVKDIAYEPFGPVRAFTYGNGIAATRTFDMDYRLMTLTDAPVQGLTYVYDGADNVKNILNSASILDSQSFDYDPLNRLTTAKGSYGSLVYTYDANGNRLTQTVSAGSTNYSYAPNSNRLMQAAAGAATQLFSYSPDGSITGITNLPDASPAIAYTYNAAGRLVSVLKGGATAFQYTYDGFGQRVMKSASAMTGTTLFQYSQDGLLLEETDRDGYAQVDYIYLDGTPVATFQPSDGKLYFLHTDRLGTPQAATDSAQNLVWKADYEPFGATATGIGIIVQNLRLPGQEFEAETDVYHNRFRDYVPALGRFLQSDPISLSSGVNSYVYAVSNPLAYTDVYGLESIPETDYLQALLPAHTAAFSKHPIGGTIETQLDYANRVNSVRWFVATAVSLATLPGPAFEIGETSVVLPGVARLANGGVQILERETNVVIGSLKVVKGEARFATEIVREGDTIFLKASHIEGQGTLKEAIAAARQYGREQGAKTVIIEGAARTTGANPGHVPRPIIVRTGL